MKLISNKKFQIYYILIAIILASVLAVLYYNNLKVKSTSDSAELAQEILRKNDNVLLDILDIEIGTRGYIISDNNLFLETFNKAVKAMNRNLASLSVLTKDNPRQSDQVASLKIKTSEKLILIRKLIDDRNENLLKESEKIEILKSGKKITDEIKDLISAINYDEYNSLKQRKTENDNSSRNAEMLFFLLLILILVIFTLVFVIVRNLKIRNDELEAFTASQKLLSNYSLSLIEASKDPLVTINIDGQITGMNEATVKITGLEREKLIGTDFFTYFTEPQMARAVYQEVFAKGSVADSPLTLRHKDGKLTDVLFNGSEYKDEQGNVLGVVVVARDITDQKIIETELIEAKVFAELATGIAEGEKRNAENATLIAENAVKAKQQFLSNMSHEIRTPMNAIIGFTKVVLKTDLSEKQKEYLAAIKMSGDALIVLINDILDLAKVDAGKMTFEKIPFKIRSSISSMLHLFETKIQEKNLTLVTEYDPNIPCVLMGDPVRLHQIILNLVSNAVKFTTKGKITVSVRLIDEDEESTTIEFAVTDTGIGVPKEKIANIFENFQQASSGTSRLYGGTGLGLAIVKQLVEPQGGTIDVQSEVGVGTTFSFRLNFEKTKLDAELDTEILELDTKINIMKVLVVEDIPLNQLLMKAVLDDFGFERDIAENGEIAIEKLKNQDYDIILMDLQMPVMNGFETTEYIRNTLKLDIPIIALTADVTTVDLAKCKSVGMNDYIPKPVDERLLYSKIVSLVRKSSTIKSEKLKRKNMPKKQRFINLEYLNARTKSNPKLMMEMIDAYLQQTPPLINTMRQSLQNEDWELLKSSVHKMVPSFSIMGLSPEYEDMAKKIQDAAMDHEDMDEINDLVLQLENTCNTACKELEIEFNIIKNTN
ncbi:MAG: PAS domain S-box-containing protein [Psychroserpens sp.]|jgi:PAS domain S-box-containing protein